jgi:hypothetical protein
MGHEGSLVPSKKPANAPYPEPEKSIPQLSIKLTLWSRFLVDTINFTQLVKKFSAFYGT